MHTLQAYTKGITMKYALLRRFINAGVDRPASLKGLFITNGRLNMWRTGNLFLSWLAKQPVVRPPPNFSPPASPLPAPRRLKELVVGAW